MFPMEDDFHLKFCYIHIRICFLSFIVKYKFHQGRGFVFFTRISPVPELLPGMNWDLNKYLLGKKKNKERKKPSERCNEVYIAFEL